MCHFPASMLLLMLFLLLGMLGFSFLPVEILQSFKVHAKCNLLHEAFPCPAVRWISFPFTVPIALTLSTVLPITVLVIS